MALTRRPEYQDFDNFVGECFIADPAGLVAARDIYSAYKDWCKRHQRPVYSHKLLGQYLKESGYIDAKRTHGRYYWLGFRLKALPTSNDKVADLQNYLSALYKITQQGKQFSEEESLILVKLALEKAREIN